MKDIIRKFRFPKWSRGVCTIAVVAASLWPTSCAKVVPE
jgi:hypothetical protein